MSYPASATRTAPSSLRCGLRHSRTIRSAQTPSGADSGRRQLCASSRAYGVTALENTQGSPAACASTPTTGSPSNSDGISSTSIA